MAGTVASNYDAALLDLDGTIYEGDRAIEWAHEGLSDAGLPMMFITNNASRAPETVAEQLRSLGYDCTGDQVMTSAQAAIGLAADTIAPGSSVYVLGAPAFKDLAREAGYTVVDSADDYPSAVLQGLNRELTWKEMSEAALSISRGAVYLVSNLDTTLPSERGFMVGNGAVAAAITTTTGVVPASAGKPQPPMFTQSAEKMGATKPLVIGDRLDTDIAGGNAAEFDTFMVVTGVSSHLDAINAPKALRPTMMGADMRALNQPLEFSQPAPQAGLVARFADDARTAVVVSGGDATSEQLSTPERAAVAVALTVAALVWDTDEAHSVETVTLDSPAALLAAAAWRNQ